MSQPHPPQPAKLVIGLFTSEKSLLEPIAEILENRFGPIDQISRWFPFDFTNYYETEMGGPLFRRLITFKPLIPQESLPEVKRFTNGIEQKYVMENRRRVNIDPGYLLLERFVLATGKNFTHRIYMSQGIYADLTLIYTKGDFQTLPWTYPDYAGEDIRGFLRMVRKKYTIDLKLSEALGLKAHSADAHS
jgi:hypothetical protein